MPEQPPESAPETPQQPHPPDGWELACIGILRSEFGRFRSRALHKAMAQLSSEQAWLEAQAEAARMGWWKRIKGTFGAHPGLRFAFGTMVVSALAVLSWFLFASIREENQTAATLASACKIADALDARWVKNSAPLKPGDNLPGGQLHLESGVVELAFASGVRAAVEGPADLRLTTRNSVELLHGKLSAEVPHSAIGFTVKTPNSTVVDLGTRFGINASAKDSSEVDVFEGKVRVGQAHDAKQPGNEWDLTRNMAMILDQRGGVTAAAAPESAFPQPGHSILIRPANCGFDTSGMTKIGGLPSAFGFWSGPAFAQIGPVGDIKPVQGAGMLRFLAPPRQPGASSDSEVWQVLDLSPAKQFMAAYGTVDLKAWVQFNRVHGDAHTATKFSLSIAAFRGQPDNIAALWAQRNQTALVVAEKELDSDDDPKTWERVEIATTVSADADFVLIGIRAIAPKEPSADPFPGHFADLIDAKVCLPLRAGTAAVPR